MHTFKYQFNIYYFLNIMKFKRGSAPDDIIICKLDEYIYTPHKLSVMPNIFLIYSRSLSLTPFKPSFWNFSQNPGA